MTQGLLVFNAMLITFNGALVTGQLDSVLTSEASKAIAVVTSSVLLAGVGVLIPKVSEVTRSVLSLRPYTRRA